MIVNRKWVLKSRPQGFLKDEDVELVTESLDWDRAQDGSVLVKTLNLLMIPTYRSSMDENPDFLTESSALGGTIDAFGSGVVLKSKSQKFKEGDLIYSGPLGFQEYSIHNENAPLLALPGSQFDIKYSLGPLSIHGLTAYFCLKDHLNHRTNSVVSASGSSGSVGTMIGQMAQLMGAERVIGFAGGREKCERLKSYGYSSVFNYREPDQMEAFRTSADFEDIHLHIELVSRNFLDLALGRLGTGGVAVVAGLTEEYNYFESEDFEKISRMANFRRVVWRRLKIEGFWLNDYVPRLQQAIEEIAGWTMSGKLKQEVYVVNGVEHFVKAFNLMFSKEKPIGNLILKVADL